MYDNKFFDCFVEFLLLLQIIPVKDFSNLFQHDFVNNVLADLETLPYQNKEALGVREFAGMKYRLLPGLRFRGPPKNYATKFSGDLRYEMWPSALQKC